MDAQKKIVEAVDQLQAIVEALEADIETGEYDTLANSNVVRCLVQHMGWQLKGGREAVLQQVGITAATIVEEAAQAYLTATGREMATVDHHMMMVLIEAIGDLVREWRKSVFDRSSLASLN